VIPLGIVISTTTSTLKEISGTKIRVYVTSPPWTVESSAVRDVRAIEAAESSESSTIRPVV
jgi:hypothetical protein